MQIQIDDLSHPAVHALLDEHLANMYAISPPESVHALDLDRLRHPSITFWSAWQDGGLVGVGALKELDPEHGEIKSMRTPQASRRQGAGRAILAHIIAVATSRGYRSLSLETGPTHDFKPARDLYARFGFVVCGPFGGYMEDPHSVFMRLELAPHVVDKNRADPVFGDPASVAQLAPLHQSLDPIRHAAGASHPPQSHQHP